ncbi:TetR/AcrR family transcriptional regulator [Leptospira sp. GIMC2001]|uniref:TetR/AcrR family transcriptional regulator n=1 Tax=Leptospira sp. GIMC2001 TaxID=1513297 RepID=UPI00234A15CB|nr:TetR/AcrR family transcriptional regulator [Leptospira sp. GIMC2001]WCL49764.1 TetR/AcrR family transcriptional regulator [Leptospira sp. GIMC2001]
MGRTKCFQREEVLEKLVPVFWKKGFADTSLHDIESATGVNKSGLYSEFKNKEDLYLESLRFYLETNTIVETLRVEPLGWKNIENYLKFGSTFAELKGCFVVNAIREISILPKNTKNLIIEYSKKSKDLLIQNLESERVFNPEKVAEMISSFNSGISIELNLDESADPTEKIHLFLEYLKNFKIKSR